MAYKTLLTMLKGAEGAEELIATAASLARSMDAHLEILCLGIDEVQVGYYFAGADSIVQQTTLEQATERATEITELAEAFAAREGIRYTARGVVAQFGALNDVIAQIARYSDLVILPQPYGEGRTTEDEALLEAALFTGQSPVLVLPESGLPQNFAERIVVGWNEGSEALNAVRAALPLLKKAEITDIAIIDPPTRGPDQAGPGRSLCALLDRHGAKTQVSALPKSMPRIADILQSHVRDQNATLLVTGAYGHSRFRQAILGGATRELLQNSGVPLLMSH